MQLERDAENDAIDISGGIERMPINCINCIDEEVSPVGSFTYIRNSIPAISGSAVFSGILGGCVCETNCTPDIKPDCFCCVAKSRGDILSSRERLCFECNTLCACSTNCSTRICQNGVRVALHLRKHAVKGWSVHATKQIEAGEFVAEYAGEMLSDEEARLRNIQTSSHRHYYLLSVCESISSSFLQEFSVTLGNCSSSFTQIWSHVDATRFGSVARFINHSCAPNLEARIFRVDYLSPGFVALYSSRVIVPDEELTFSYGEARHTGATSPCYCEAPECCGFMPFDAKF